MEPIRNVVVLGASYSGAHAAEMLAKTLPPTHRVVVIERVRSPGPPLARSPSSCSHFNHLYLWPRYGVVPGHEQNAFIPYDNHLKVGPTLSEDQCPRADASSSRGIVVHAEVVSIGENHIDLDRDLCEIPGLTEPEMLGEVVGKPGKLCCGGDGCDLSPAKRCRGTRVPFTHLIYALGSILPRPLLTSARTKEAGIAFLRRQQEAVRQAQRILIVGGGALGLQMACDIADTYPDKRLTLVHPHDRFLPLFKPFLHEQATRRLKELGVEVIMGDRVILPQCGRPGEVDAPMEHVGPSVTRTYGGRTIEADLRIFATGQRPNTQLMRDFLPQVIQSNGLIRIQRTLQVDDDRHANIYAVGDCADQFGAIQAGHTGWNAADIAAQNVVKQIEAAASGDKLNAPALTLYEPSKPMIKLTLGLRESVTQLVGDDGELVTSYQTDGPPAGHWEVIWKSFKADPSDPYA